MDHQYSQYNSICNEDVLDVILEECVDDTETENVSVNNVSVPEKEGDDYLIQLYRERRFLYDKSHRNFRGNELKNNAWKEISSIMQNKNMGNVYTAEYCKRRMTSLREKYIKLKKEQECKSGSAACTTKKSTLLSELSFLDVYIQRRRTLTNMKENYGSMPASSSNKNAVECPETNVAESTNFKKRNYKKLCQDNIEDDLTENLCDQTSSKIFKKVAASTKKYENNSFHDLTNAALNIAKQLQTDSKLTEDIGCTSAEQAFAQFIVLSLQKMQDSERNIRQNKIFHVLTAPLEQLM